MKVKMLLTPLAFALASVLAVGGAYAAEATVEDTQTLTGNNVSNEGTENTASSTSSADGATGNVGVNVAAGTINQQANAAALASEDAALVLGTATASTTVTQTIEANGPLGNIANPSEATLSGTLGDSSGNVGVNVAAGTFNQQKNDLAAASVTINDDEVAASALASSSATQSISGQTILNESAADDGTFTFGPAVTLDAEGTLGTVHVTNIATMDGSLSGATGNVGANVVAGSGNQQSNSLAIAAVTSGAAAGGVGGGVTP